MTKGRLRRGEALQLLLKKTKETGDINKENINKLGRLDWAPAKCPIVQGTFITSRSRLAEIFEECNKKRKFREKSLEEKYKILSEIIDNIQKYNRTEPKHKFWK